MLYHHPTLFEFARDLFEEEWELTHRPCSEGPLARLGPGGPPLDACPMTWLLPDLVELVVYNCHRPTRSYAATIRRLIVEQQMHGTAGDTCSDPQDENALEDYLERVLRVMERVRLRALAEGRRSADPAAPQMFG